MVPYTSVVGARSLVYGLQVFREATPQLRLLHLDGSVLYYDRRGGPRPPPMNRRRAHTSPSTVTTTNESESTYDLRKERLEVRRRRLRRRRERRVVDVVARRGELRARVAATVALHGLRVCKSDVAVQRERAE